MVGKSLIQKREFVTLNNSTLQQQQHFPAYFVVGIALGSFVGGG